LHVGGPRQAGVVVEQNLISNDIQMNPLIAVGERVRCEQEQDEPATAVEASYQLRRTITTDIRLYDII